MDEILVIPFPFYIAFQVIRDSLDLAVVTAINVLPHLAAFRGMEWRTVKAMRYAINALLFFGVTYTMWFPHRLWLFHEQDDIHVFLDWPTSTWGWCEGIRCPPFIVWHATNIGSGILVLILPMVFLVMRQVNYTKVTLNLYIASVFFNAFVIRVLVKFFYL